MGDVPGLSRGESDTSGHDKSMDGTPSTSKDGSQRSLHRKFNGSKYETPWQKAARITRWIEKKETLDWIEDVQQPLLDQLAAWQHCEHGVRRYRCGREHESV
jgi:hypothetical protein